MEKLKKWSCEHATLSKIAILALSLALFVGIVFAVYAIAIPQTVTCFAGEDMPSFLGATFEATDEVSAGTMMDVSHGQYKLFGAIPVRSVTVQKIEDEKVFVGGIPFGIKFLTKGVCVVGFENEATNPAYKAGLRLHDLITKVNGKEIVGSAELSRAIEGGGEISLTFIRAGRETTVKFNPRYDEASKKHVLDLWLKDSGAGIGTLTYVLPNGSFGGLGHGICDGETGELTPIINGSVLGVTVNGVVRGKRGTPGELKGYFNSSKVGAIYKNTENGVFGTIVDIPELIKGKTYSIALKDEIKEGEASILCTLDDNVRREYKIEISNINRNADGNKCFTVKVVDEKLLAATGGIVQGMSGSPIIQNGKLVGAVTHVLINDPTTGYGIFIENMLAGANTPVLKAA